MGLLFLPIAAALAGPEGFRGLSQESKSLFALANQVCETAVGIWAVRSVTKGYEPLPEDLFNYDFRSGNRQHCWQQWNEIRHMSDRGPNKGRLSERALSIARPWGSQPTTALCLMPT